MDLKKHLDMTNGSNDVKQTSLIDWKYRTNNMYLYRIEYKNGSFQEIEVDRHYPNKCDCVYESVEDVEKRLKHGKN